MPQISRHWLIRVLAVNVLVGSAVYALRPIVSFRAIELGAGPVALGLIGGAYALIPFFIAVVVGRWVDRWGEPVFLAVGTAGIGLTALALIWASSLTALWLGMAALGLSQILTAISIQTLIANAEEAGLRDSRFGWQSVAASSGQFAGPLVAGFVAGAPLDGASGPPVSGYGLVFLMGAAIGLIASVIALTFTLGGESHRRALRDESHQSTVAAAVHIVRLPGIPQAMFASMAVLTSVDVLIVYLPAFALQTGIDVQTVGLLLAVRAGASIMSRSAISGLRARASRRQLLTLALLIPGVVLAAVPIAGPFPVLLFAIMAITGFGLGLGQPLTAAWVANQSPVAMRGTAVGLRLTGNRFGQLIVPAALGVIAAAAGIAGAFWSVTAILIVGSMLVASVRLDDVP